MEVAKGLWLGHEELDIRTQQWKTKRGVFLNPGSHCRAQRRGDSLCKSFVMLQLQC